MRRKAWVILSVAFIILLVTSSIGAVVLFINFSNDEENDIRLKLESNIIEFWEDYNISISIWNVGKDPVDFSHQRNCYFNMTIKDPNGLVRHSERISEWNINPIKGLSEGQTKRIKPGAKMELNFTWFTGWNIYQIYENDTIIPYGEYRMVSELVVKDERYTYVDHIDHNPVIKMDIFGEIREEKGFVSVSLTNMRDYPLDFVLPYPGLTEISIYDSTERLVAGGPGPKICVTMPVYIPSHHTTYVNRTFGGNWWDKVEPGGYHIVVLCLATPIQEEAWIYFE